MEQFCYFIFLSSSLILVTTKKGRIQKVSETLFTSAYNMQVDLCTVVHCHC